ncbi:MAG: AAA family ATPase [Chloroflexota bacterium]|nr:AAA family ATPase [Chloroflexota bacterium]
MLEVVLLGQFNVRLDGEPVDLASRRTQTLLAYLLLNVGVTHNREHVAGVLWPDSLDTSARKNLRNTLYQLRKALNERYLLADKTTLAFDTAEPYKLDVALLEEDAAETDTEALIRAVAAYQGELLPGFYQDWVLLERERLRALFERRGQLLLEQLETQARWREMKRWAEHWIAQGQVPEPAYRALMTACAAQGDLAGMASAYRRCVQALEEEVGVPPSPETQTLYERLSRGEVPTAKARGDSTPTVTPSPTPSPQERYVAKERLAVGGQPVASLSSGTGGSPGPLPSPLRYEDAGLPTPVGMRMVQTVGREAELERLHGMLDRALAGTRQVVFVTGESGLGKTTLVNTFLAEARHKAPVWIGHGQCVEHQGAGEAYMPVLETLGRMSRWPGGEVLIALLSERAPTWLVQMPWLISREELESLQHKVLGTTRERMLREMVEFLEFLTMERPLILVLEDLQWSDYSTLDLLAWLARRYEPARLLIVGTYRSSDVQVHDHPLRAVARELQVRGQCTEVALPFLSRTEVEAYLSLRFPGLDQPGKLARLLHQRTDGNPLFTQVVVDTWVSQGALAEDDGRWIQQAPLEELTNKVPDSLRRLIEQQLAELDSEEQEILEAASVAGMSLGFSAAAVAAGVPYTEEEVETRCTVLARRGQFLRDGGIAEWPDGTVAARFEFIHHLYQEVLYERVPAGRCVRLHRQVGMRLEEGYGRQAREKAATLALHFVRGRDPQRAVQYLQFAAEHALQRSAHREAVEHLRRGLEILRDHPDLPEGTRYEAALQTALGPALIAIRGWSAPEAEQAYVRACNLCERLGDRQRLSSVLYGLATLHELRGEYTRSQALLEERLQLEHDSQDDGSRLESHELLACSTFHQGAFAESLDHAEQGLELYDPQQHLALIAFLGENPGVSCRHWAALDLWFLGYPDRALARIHEALNLAHDLAHSFSLAHAQEQAASLHQHRREPQAVQERAEATITLATQHGYPYRIGTGKILRGWAMTAQGHEEGIAELRDGLATCQATGVTIDHPYYLALLADAYGKDGQIDAGLDTLSEALEMARNSKAFFYEAELHRLQGELLLQANAANNLEEAEMNFQQALKVAHRQGARILELRALGSLGRLYHSRRMQSQVTETCERLAELYDEFTEGFDTVDLREAKALLRELRDGGR